jgi:hypothetical protein
MKSDILQVRKSAATNLKFLIAKIPKFPEAEATSLFQLVCKDEQDVVRFTSVDNLLAIGKALPPAVKFTSNRVEKRSFYRQFYQVVH